MIKDFVVNIETLTAAVSQFDFGTILILGDSRNSDFQYYTDIAQMTDGDFVVADTEVKLATVLFAQSPRTRRIAVLSHNDLTDANAVAYLNAVAGQSYYGLVSTVNSAAMISALSTYAQANEKMYAVTTENLASVNAVDVDAAIVGYHDDIDEKNYVAEALLQHLLVREIGSTTGKARRLQGISTADLTVTELNTLTDNNGITYIEKYGVAQTSEGFVSTGEYIDVVLGAAFIKARIEEGLAQLLVNTPKIPYSNDGISQLVGVVRNVLKIATAQGIILEEDGQGVFEINFVAREDAPSTDIANRVYNGVSFIATLAGAIHEGTVSGQLIL